MRALFAELAAFPVRLEAWLATCPSERLRHRPTPEAFAPVEHLWHLADLEVEAYSTRMQRLMEEDHPQLNDFDGSAVAKEREYLRRDPLEALSRFRIARMDLIQRFEALPSEAWAREGVQDGVGPLRMADIPLQMFEHDAGHWRDLQNMDHAV